MDFDEEEQQISYRERETIEKALNSNGATNDSHASHEALLQDIFGNEQNQLLILLWEMNMVILPNRI